jgi:phosphoglycerate dehydrogenase-like enzyme
MTQRAVMILDEDAAECAALLNDLTTEGVALAVARTPDEALAAYTGQSILLGAPDLIAQVLPKMPTVEWVQSTWAGVESLLALDRRDYVLTGVKGVLGQQMGEYVIGHLLAHELKIFQRAEQQRQRKWFDECSGTLSGKAIGIMGAGSISQQIAQMIRPFKMRVTGYSRSGRPVDGFEQMFAADQLDVFLEDLDYLVSVLPDTPATTRLLNFARLRHLPSRAYYINIGRGNVVDEAALHSALETGELAGAVLDVFDHEPLPESSPLWTTPNLRITGHVAAVTHAEDIAPIFADNCRRFMKGGALHHVIDFDLGY